MGGHGYAAAVGCIEVGVEWTGGSFGVGVEGGGVAWRDYG